MGDSTARQVWRFTVAVFSDWKGVVAGGGGTIVTIAGFIFHEYAATVFLIVGFVAVVFACFRAWQAEHEKVLTYEARDREAMARADKERDEAPPCPH